MVRIHILKLLQMSFFVIFVTLVDWTPIFIAFCAALAPSGPFLYMMIRINLIFSCMYNLLGHPPDNACTCAWLCWFPNLNFMDYERLDYNCLAYLELCDSPIRHYLKKKLYVCIFTLSTQILLVRFLWSMFFLFFG